MSTYVDVPKEAIVDRLEAAGFQREQVRGEVTYVRPHDRDQRLTVKVYTSIPEQGASGRGCGEDAIRVIALFSWQRKGEDLVRHKRLYQSRVYRVTSVEGVLDRMIERAREAYGACNQWLRAQRP